ncbi:MAG: hypothetical protein APF77_19150 [Clostridia bacterium BRH_c25]|nr:MAG: hypothetical protein APF77_19150 [Clostridia bacterium BRH_c25]
MKRIIVSLLIFLFTVSMISCSKDTEAVDAQPEPQVKRDQETQAKKEQDNKVDLKLQNMTGKEKDSSEVFAVKGTNGADKGFEKLMELMDSRGLSFYKTSSRPAGLISKDDVVLLKFNCQWSERGGTNTDLIRSVVGAITKHPEEFEGEIIIADNGQSQYGPFRKGGSVEWKDNNAVDTAQSVKKVAEAFAKDYRVSALTWDGMTTKEVGDYSKGDYEDGFILIPEETSAGLQISYPKFKTQYGTYVSFKDGIWNEEKKEYERDRLKVINMPVLKSHVTYQVTASIKSYMGTTSDKLTHHGAHNSVAAGGMGTQMAGTRMPVLNIIDAIWINPYPRRGPSTSYESAVEANIIAAGTDPGALDYWAARYILMEAAKKLELINYEAMDPAAREPGTFGYWLGKSVEELRKAGIKSTAEEKKITVYVDTLGK